LSGTSLSKDEIELLKDIKPFGFILFSRNIVSIHQLKKLIKDIRNIVKWECPILIDQEGGRVQRLVKPNALSYPPSRLFGNIAKYNLIDAEKAVFLNYKLIGSDLINIGINVNCAPCIDVTSKLTHSVIGDRAFSSDAKIVARLGQQACKGLLNLGVIPIIKHIPGHGRATSDSHKVLPIIKDKIYSLNNKDFYPFKYLCNMPIAMTAHIIYKHIDNKYPISTSKKAYNFIRNQIKFKGIIVSDDIGMKALSGSIEEKIGNINSAGYDIVLHCSGKIKEIKKVLMCSQKIDKDVIRKWSVIIKNNKSIKIQNTQLIKSAINKILKDNLNTKWNF